MISDVIAEYIFCEDLQPPPPTNTLFRKTANKIVPHREYIHISSLKMTSCILAENKDFYYHTIHFKPIVLRNDLRCDSTMHTLLGLNPPTNKVF